MVVAAKVTLIGNNQAYLDVRGAVLVHFWQVATFALDQGAEPDLSNDLAVICASLTSDAQQGWVDRIRLEKPQMLIVRMNGFDSGPLNGADATVDDDHGPGALVSTIYELLTERGLESRDWPEPIEGGWVQ
jgi:hypothetical protein